ncbi:MAG TPA: hypothetical protein GXZ36_02360 [Firmicutes bacterium]|nr:hypothetical protein [Bacillota bacterium]
MAKSMKRGLCLLLFLVFLFLPATAPRSAATPQLPAEFYYRALITSGEFSQEIQHYQSGEFIRHVVTTPGFSPSVTIFRPDLAVIWIYDEGGAEYSASPYDPRLIPEIFALELVESSSIKRQNLGHERILDYNTTKIRITDPSMPEWEVYIWNASKLGGMTLKKLERVTNNGKIVSELLVEVKEIKINPIPPEYFQLPPGMTLVEGLSPKAIEWDEDFLPDIHY